MTTEKTETTTALHPYLAAAAERLTHAAKLCSLASNTVDEQPRETLAQRASGMANEALRTILNP